MPAWSERTATALVLPYAADGGDGFANQKGGSIRCRCGVVKHERIKLCASSSGTHLHPRSVDCCDIFLSRLAVLQCQILLVGSLL